MTIRKNPIRNITRYTYDYAGFQGWRLAICRYHVNYVRYFADKEYGSADASLAAAMDERRKIFARMASCPHEPGKVLAEFAAQKPVKTRRGRRCHRDRKNQHCRKSGNMME